jgi:cell division protein FtsB
MTSKRLNLLLSVLIVLLFVGLIGGAYLLNSALASKATKLTALKAKDKALEEENISLKKAKKDIKKYSSLNSISKSIVPKDKDQAVAVREIVNIAAKSGISLSAINFPSSTLGQGPAGAAAPAASAAKPAPVNLKTAGLSQLIPVKGIPGIYQLDITVVGDSNRPIRYAEFINFLSALENNRRTAQVNSITLAPDAKNPEKLTFTLSLNEYIKP